MRRLVGRLAGDKPDIQVSLMQLVADTRPDNVFQAEVIIRQAIAGPVRREVQDSLFGSEEIVQSLFRERARVLDNAVKKLRKDQRVFRTLLNEDKSITKAGDNRLDNRANQRRVIQDAETQTIITRLATRKGGVSDALDKAASRYASGESLAAATRDFVNAVRSLTDQSGTRPGVEAGGGAGGAGRAADGEDANASRPETGLNKPRGFFGHNE